MVRKRRVRAERRDRRGSAGTGSQAAVECFWVRMRRPYKQGRWTFLVDQSFEGYWGQRNARVMEPLGAFEALPGNFVACVL